MSQLSPDIPQLPDPRRWKILGVLALIQFMLVLDDTVVNVALPSLQNDLGFSNSGLAWVVNAYVLTFGGLLLLGGRAGDLFGRRRMFLIGTATFAFASLTSGLAQTSEMLIVSRVLQGIGAAIVAPSALAIITLLFLDPNERAKALGIWGGLAGLGGTSGVLISGALTDLASWRWIFFINLPLAAIALYFVPRMVRESRLLAEKGIDYVGGLTVTATTFLLTYGLLNAGTDSWGDTKTVAALIGSAVSFVAFLLWERRISNQLIPLEFFRNRTRASANVTSLFLTSSFFAMFFSLTLYMQDVLHYSPLKTGFAYLPFGFSLIAAVGISSALLPKVGVRNVMIAGFTIGAIGMYQFTGVSPQGTYVSDILPGMLIMAFGMGLTFPALTIAAVHNVDDESAGLASGIQNTVQQVGGGLGLAVLVSLAVRHTRSLAEGGTEVPAAMSSGFSLSFGVAAAVLTVGALLSAIAMERVQVPQAEETTTEVPAPVIA